jgi:hypothetical protein
VHNSVNLIRIDNMRRGRDRDEGMVYVSIVLIVLFGCLSLPGKYEHI